MQTLRESSRAFIKTQKQGPASSVEMGEMRFQESAEKSVCHFLFFLSLNAAVVYSARMQIYW